MQEFVRQVVAEYLDLKGAIRADVHGGHEGWRLFERGGIGARLLDREIRCLTTVPVAFAEAEDVAMLVEIGHGILTLWLGLQHGPYPGSVERGRGREGIPEEGQVAFQYDCRGFIDIDMTDQEHSVRVVAVVIEEQAISCAHLELTQAF